MQKIVRLIGILCLGFLLCSGVILPASAASLEEQVLQIIRQHPEAIIESVQAYQQRQQEQLQAQRQAFLQQMRAEPTAVIQNSPTLGAARPLVVLVEFSDFQCPFCAQARPAIADFMARHGDVVALVDKHFPLTPIHPQALPAAQAAWAAQQQGRYWDYHDALFDRQEQLSESLYDQIAADLNLDRERFRRDRRSGQAIMAINQDVALAKQLGLTGTPFFLLNDKILPLPLELGAMEAALADSLAVADP